MNTIPQFPVLIKTSNKGKENGKNKILRWYIEIVHTQQDGYAIHTTFGEEGGIQQTHISHVTEGRANRSVLEQAISLATSKWNEKTQRDTYSQVGVHSHSSLRPMLAQTYTLNSVKKSSRGYVMPFPLFVQRKYDGIRCMTHIDVSSVDCHVIMESRKGVAFQSFPLLKDEIFRYLFQGFTNSPLYFDGELYTSSLPFEVINGLTRLTRKKLEKEEIERINQIEYHVYDVHDPKRPHMTYCERMQLLNELTNSCRTSKRICIVPTWEAKEPQDIKRYHDQFVQEGFEGIMLRDPLGVYETDKRSKYLQKYKEFFEEEFNIVGYHDGEGIDTGLVIWECITQDGVKFSAKPRGTHEERREWFQNARQYIGKKLTVIFQEYSQDGTPRFPIGKSIRHDS
jgi:ATP-dependent DNA ligase